MATQYFACLFRLRGEDHYVIWYSDDRDGVLREDGRIVTFPSLETLEAYALQRGIKIERAKAATYDWDMIERWCDAPTANGIAVDAFLNAWNMIVDTLPALAQPTLFAHTDSRNGTLYNKLFRANNLPAMTPPGADYYPVWTTAEIDALARVLRLGVMELRRQVGSRLTDRSSGPA